MERADTLTIDAAAVRKARLEVSEGSGGLQTDAELVRDELAGRRNSGTG